MPGSNRKILIVSASIGAGHNQAANAIKTAWKISYPNDTINIIDFMADDNSHLNYLIKEIYLKTITISPDLYETLYRWTQGSGAGTKVQDMLSWVMRRSMARIIQHYHPDLIICTHPFPCGATAYLRRKNKLSIPIVGVVTDFAVHSLWTSNEVSHYIIAAPELMTDLLKQGISASCISATGIPIHPSFSRISQRNLSNPLPNNKAKPVVLIMGGGLGIGRMGNLLLGLNSSPIPLEIIVVAGSNISLREDLKSLAKYSPHDVRVFGYTEHILELMQASDILITKPGALTISEALAAELPMLFIEPIPGQEIDNAAFVIDKGAAYWLINAEAATRMDGGDINGQLTYLLTNPAELTTMRAAARKISRPQSAIMAVTIINSMMERTLLASAR